MNIRSTYHRSEEARARAIESAAAARKDAFDALNQAEKREASLKTELRDHFDKTDSRAYTLSHSVGFGTAVTSTGLLAGAGQALGLPLNGAVVLALGVASAALGIGAGVAMGKRVRVAGEREARETHIPALREAIKESIAASSQLVEALKRERDEHNKPLVVISQSLTWPAW